MPLVLVVAVAVVVFKSHAIETECLLSYSHPASIFQVNMRRTKLRSTKNGTTDVDFVLVCNVYVNSARNVSFSIICDRKTLYAVQSNIYVIHYTHIMHPRAFMFWFRIEEIHIHVLIPRFHSSFLFVSLYSSAVQYNKLHEIIDSYRNTSKQIHWRRLVPQIQIDSKTMLMNYIQQ